MSRSTPAVLTGGQGQIHLAGFMGSGKSTVGRLLARRLLWNFLDLDGVIERHDGRTIARIFEEDGEAVFRGIERHVLRQVVGKPATVVALGGGTLIDAGNQELSRRSAVLVWLQCPLELLRERCGTADEKRPLWGDPAALERRFEERLPGYLTAPVRVDARGAQQQVVAAVLDALDLEHHA